MLTNFTTPDFSSGGLPLKFGYYTFNGSPSHGDPVDQTWGIDNFKVTVHSVIVPVAQATWGAIKATYR